LPKNEDGEFELILGNKQLLSMFFVVVVLLGVFFVMGYIVGRNSAPLVAGETPRNPEGKPLTVESPVPKEPAPQAPASSASSASAASAPAPEKTPEAAPAPAQTAKAEKPASETAPKRQPKDAETTDQAKAKPVAAASNPAVGATYLQLSATDKADADKMVDVLRKSNFVALDAEVPEKPGLFRVLVGPIPSGELNKTKADLKAKGFPDGIRKTF
jgi:cell division septation protein DedD